MYIPAKTAKTTYSIEQLQLLRSARGLIKSEFGFSLSVSASSVLDDLYTFAIKSADEKLFALHREIIAIGERTKAEAATRAGSPRNTAYRGSASNVEAEDVTSSRVRTYRGSVVSSPVRSSADSEKATYYRGVRV